MNTRLATYSALTLLLISTPVSAHEEVFSGTYVWGHEVRSFQPCGSDSVFWTSYNWAGLELEDFYRAHTQEPYQLIYVKFRGQILDERVDGFARDYDGLIRISEVLEKNIVIPSECAPEPNPEPDRFPNG